MALQDLVAMQMQYQLDSARQMPQIASLCAWTGFSLIPRRRLICISHAFSDRRGGALLSELYRNIYHGDPDWSRVGLKLLTASCRPLLATILKWIYEGALDDLYDEVKAFLFPAKWRNVFWSRCCIFSSSLEATMTRCSKTKLRCGVRNIFYANICYRRLWMKKWPKRWVMRMCLIWLRFCEVLLTKAEGPQGS